MAKKKTE